MAWIGQDPEAQKQIKDFQLSTSEWRQVRQRNGNALRSTRIKHGGAYLWVTRKMVFFARTNVGSVNHIQIK